MKMDIPLSEPQISKRELFYAKKCIESGWISSSGSFVDSFEKKIADLLGTKHAISCINGTSAIHIALIVAGVEKGDEVIVPTVTFIATVNTVKYAGAEPVFMDCDDYLNIDTLKLKEFITKKCLFRNGVLINRKTKRRIKAVIPVHIFGHPVDIETIMFLAQKYNIKVIEDAAQSLGSFYTKTRYKGKKTGSVGHLGCLSFNGNKIITSGGGGMIVTDSSDMAQKARYFTTQARDDADKYVHNSLGYNYRLSNVHAAIGLAQLEKINKFIEIKRKNFELYARHFKNIEGLRLLREPEYGFSNYWFYSLIVEKNKFGVSAADIIKKLKSHGIAARLIWQLNHRQKLYKKNEAYKIEKAPRFYNRVLNIPCSVGLKEKSIKDIAVIIKGLGSSGK